MYFYRNEEILKDYTAKISSKAFLVFGRNKSIINAILSRLDSSNNYFNRTESEKQLNSILWTDATAKMSDIFSGSEYKVLVTLLGQEWAAKFKKIWDRSSEYIYSSGPLRRSFRTKKLEATYLLTAIEKLLSMIQLVATDFTYEKYFSQKDNTYAYNNVIPDLIAFEIDEGNETVKEKIKNIIYGDNNSGLINREIIKGLLMSRSEEAHKWIGDLLIAAKLQEGLRQTIVECMDEGSRAGFLYILKVIIDNNLLRFSSVVRAVDVWTGLDISAQKPNIIKKCLDTCYKCLTESGFADECIKSDDVMLIYMGLWSIAFDEIMNTEDWIKKLLTENQKYKKLAALGFLKQAQFPWFQHRLALPLLDDPDYEVKAWVLVNLFSDENYISLRSGFGDSLVKYTDIKDTCSVEQLFYKLKMTIDNMPKKEIVFSESLFPWWQVAINCNEIIVKMLLTLSMCPSDNKVDLMLDYLEKMSADTRCEFVSAFLGKPKTDRQKTAIVELMGDKSGAVRDSALRIVETLNLSKNDYKIIEEMLKYKSGDLRKNAISILLRQSPDDLMGSIRRLCEDGDENKLHAGLDIISAIDKNAKYKSFVQECHEIAASHSGDSQQIKVLADKITKKNDLNLTAANGFGLYDPKAEISFDEVDCQKGFTSKQILSSDISEIKKIILAFSSLIEKNKEYEYEVEDWNGEYTKVILGGEFNIRSINNHQRSNSNLSIDDYPLAHVWREAAKEYNLTAEKVIEILFYYNYERNQFSEVKEWYSSLMSKLFPINYAEFDKLTKDMEYVPHVHTILSALLSEYQKSEVFSICKDMARYIYKSIPAKRFTERYTKDNEHTYYGWHRDYLMDARVISFWNKTMRASIFDDSSFIDYFKTLYSYYKASEFKSHGALELKDFDRAYSLNLVDENELYMELCSRPLSPENIRSLTDSGYYQYKDVSSSKKLNELCKKAIDIIVSIELKRGDMTTEVSHLAAKIYKYSGTKFFVDILVGAEKDTFVRGYNFVGDDSTKKQIFSHLLKCCFPADGEDEKTLRELIKHIKVTEKQLIDAAMYSPQWIDIVEKYLNWPGLKSACWYFHAHINETFSNDKETIVSRFSPVSPQDFKDGAFDINWFNEAYSALGEKRFKIVYDSAKYIAGGGLHKRAQLFADAVLGKIEEKQAEKIISDKRNKDYVLCYGLIPLKGDKKAMLRRFEFLHNFLKESKQFGAQRRESESKAVTISLQNLALNAGFTDVARFTWYMETEKIRTIEKYLMPAMIEDIQVYISINELGKAEIAASKGDKPLKDIPSKYKENEYIKEIKTVQKALKSQYQRARVTLEKAMESGDEFTFDELQNLSYNPVIYPLLQNLVFKSGNLLGYLKDGTLCDANGKVFNTVSEDKYIIAHPVHLYESGEWAAFQRDIYDRKIVQPFKQVFRELYKPNSDELESATMSRRYAGYQIQPNKAAALLKGRGWTASYEEGLQKVYYKENIIAQIYAMADWFSPADVEAPTIEGLQFFDRKTGKPVLFADVSKLIFSEIMRDIDLVVSVAHVGGVDPEASLSTIEMRTAIVEEMLRLLKITNVNLKGSHAYVKGSLGEYTVHLGSGVVHKMASGALYILPIHSQHRGRIFLPFVDEDPKTAEIISKIVLLAEDSKIKDPTILVQIRS